MAICSGRRGTKPYDKYEEDIPEYWHKDLFLDLGKVQNYPTMFSTASKIKTSEFNLGELDNGVFIPFVPLWLKPSLYESEDD